MLRKIMICFAIAIVAYLIIALAFLPLMGVNSVFWPIMLIAAYVMAKGG